MEEMTTAKDGRFKRSFKEIFYFLTSGVFLRNFALMLLSLLGLLLFVHFGMKWYTQHGNYLQVPSFKNLTVAEAAQKAADHKLKVIVNDSIWTSEHPPGIVIGQSPEALASVKKKRSIYLTITKFQAAEKTLPSLVGNDNFDYYQRRLKQMKIGITVRQKQLNNKLEENTILYLYVDDKRISLNDLKKGVKVPQGSEIEAVVSTRGAGRADIPNLKCKTIAEAELLISASRLAVGSITGDNTWRAGELGFVWQQNPRYIEGNTLRAGTPIDLKVTKFRPSNCQ